MFTSKHWQNSNIRLNKWFRTKYNFQYVIEQNKLLISIELWELPFLFDLIYLENVNNGKFIFSKSENFPFILYVWKKIIWIIVLNNNFNKKYNNSIKNHVYYLLFPFSISFPIICSSHIRTYITFYSSSYSSGKIRYKTIGV